MLSVVALVTGIGFQMAQQPDVLGDLSPGDRLRVATLAAAGAGGLATFIYGLLLVVFDYPSVFVGKIEVMRENLRTIMLCALPLFGGMVLMYAGMALGRKFERTQATVRRVIYGYNAVLGAVLLLSILGLLNMLAYTHVPPFSSLGRTFDWTKGNLYTLQEGTRKTVEGLKEPVDIKVIFGRDDPTLQDVVLLLENVRLANPDVHWSIVSPYEEDNTLRELAKNYTIPGEGLLILYGKPGAQVGEFIKKEELFVAPDFDRRHPMGEEPIFQGEFALNKTLSYLEEGRTRTTIYFTQGHGELNYNDASSNGRDQGLGKMAALLAKGNYDLLQGPADKLPEKADVVVIAGPREELNEASLTALRRFLKPGGGKKPGKLLILFDVTVLNDKMVETGLGKLVADYGVTVSDKQLLCAKMQNPRDVMVMPHVGGSNPIPKAFYKGERGSVFPWYNVRSVQAGPPNPGRPYTTEVLFDTYPPYLVWEEDNLKAEPADLARALLQDEKKFVERIAQQPLPVAVAVSESSASGLPPGHPGTGNDKPVLIVFGSTSWASNRQAESAGSFNLMSGSLGWLRERPVLGEAPKPPERPTYELNVTDDQKFRMYWLPGILILMTIISLSLGVWLVRRR